MIQNLLPVNPRAAPRKKLRGRRNYFRRILVLKDMESDIREVTAYFAALLPGYRLRTVKQQREGESIYLVYSPDVGVPLECEPVTEDDP